MNYDSNKVTSPISFPKDGKWRTNPLQYIEDGVNDEYNFAITKLTDNGKFVIGESLHYKMKDIDIFTELDNIIFVDLRNNTLWIKDFVKVENSLSLKDPESREYVLLLRDIGYENATEGFPLRWEPAVGRSNAYEILKPNLPLIDIDNSFVLVDTVSLKDSLSVRQFISHLQNAGYVDPDEIDLNDYFGNDYI